MEGNYPRCAIQQNPLPSPPPPTGNPSLPKAPAPPSPGALLGASSSPRSPPPPPMLSIFIPPIFLPPQAPSFSLLSTSTGPRSPPPPPTLSIFLPSPPSPIFLPPPMPSSSLPQHLCWPAPPPTLTSDDGDSTNLPPSLGALLLSPERLCRPVLLPAPAFSSPTMRRCRRPPSSLPTQTVPAGPFYFLFEINYLCDSYF